MNVSAISLGETAWSPSSQHTGTTEIPLTNNGRRGAERMRLVLVKEALALVLCSPISRHQSQCDFGGGNADIL